MLTCLMLVLGGIGGFFVKTMSMKIDFKQRTVERKIKVYDAIITYWAKMRNFIYHELIADSEKIYEFDKMYGESQAFMGEAILVCEDQSLTEKINELNERLYRQEWFTFFNGPNGFEVGNEIMEGIKVEAFEVISRMREDVRKSTDFHLIDFSHMFMSIFPRKKKTGK